MTQPHPLTYEICEEIYPWCVENFECLFDSDAESTRRAMRAAADWQLEQCVEELECLLSIFGATGVIKEEAVPTMVELFRSNMRPQEDNS